MPIYEQAIKVREAAFGPKSPEVVETLEYYSKLLNQISEFQQSDSMKSRLKMINDQAN